MATEETTAAGEAFSAADEGGAVAPVSPAAEAYFADQADRLRRGEALTRATDSDAADQDCLADAGLPDHEVAAVVGEDEGAGVPDRYLAAVPAGEPIGPDTAIHFVDSDRCQVVYTDR
jgi:hypothetical protein